MKRYVRELSDDVLRAIEVRYANGEISAEARNSNIEKVGAVLSKCDRGYITEFESCEMLLVIERSMWEICSSWDVWEKEHILN